MEPTAYSLWSEKTDEIRWFWIVDSDDETIIDSGIENTKEEAIAKIRNYLPYDILGNSSCAKELQ